MGHPSPTQTLLDWHQARRAEGVPTVTVLVGPVGLGLREWLQWADARGVPVAQVVGDSLEAFVRPWVAEAFAEIDPVALAHRWATGQVGAEIPAPSSLTRYDLDRLWRAVPVDPADPTATAAYLVLAAMATKGRFDPVGFAHDLSADRSDATRGAVRVFAGVHGLDPGGRWPGLLGIPPGPDDHPGWFGRAVRALEAVAAAVPQLPIGLCVPPPVFEAAVTATPDSRTTALAREGMVPVRGVTAAELAGRIREAAIAPPPPADTVRRLTADGLAPETADAFVAAVRTLRTAAPTDAADDFRSVHERFLFEQLQSLPATAGLFRPNRPLAFLHGFQTAEADLVADRLKIVVEVDGAHYHLNPPQYRRDRRKDWLYQRHGYVVLRFLAEDVVDDLEAILTTILDAVALRRGGSSSEG